MRAHAGRALWTITFLTSGLLAGCADRPSSPTEPEGGELLGRGAPDGCLGVDQQAFADAIRADIDALLSSKNASKPAHQHLNNIERKLCEEDYEDALDKAWGFLELLEGKMNSGFEGSMADAAGLASSVFALVAAEPNPADPAFEIPDGAFDPETGGIITFDPSTATPDNPIVAATGNNEAAIVVDAPDAFPPGTGAVTVVLSRSAGDAVVAPGGYIPGFQAFEEGYEILSSHQPWDQGSGVLVALCGVPPLPDNAAIGHLHEEEVSLLVPTDPDPQELGYIDCSDVEPTTTGGEASLGESQTPFSSPWVQFARRTVGPVARLLAPRLLHAEFLLVGPGLGGRTKSLSLNAPVDPTIEVGETVQLSVGADATWGSDNSSVASVDQNGVVMGVGPGTATITADFVGPTGSAETLSIEITVEATCMVPEGHTLVTCFAFTIEPGDWYGFVISSDQSPDCTEGDIRRTKLAHDYVLGSPDGFVRWGPDDPIAPHPVTETMDVYTFQREGCFDVFRVFRGAGQAPLSTTIIVSHSPPTPASEQIAFTLHQGGNYEIYTVGIDGSNLTNVTNDPAIDYAPTWSPDGSRIAFGSTRDGATTSIYTMNADGTGISGPFGINPAILPSWSTDGSQIAYNNQAGIHVMNADGTDAHWLDGVFGSYPDWSPDGTMIAFVGGGIHVVNADGSGEVSGLTVESDRYPSWSPDGTRIAFSRGLPDGTDVFVMDADGTNLVNLTARPGPDLMPDWSPDGSQIVFVSDRSGGDGLWIMNADGSDPFLVTVGQELSYPRWQP